MKLFDYLMMFKEDVVFDVPDTKIDNVVTVYFSEENAEKISNDFPYFVFFFERNYERIRGINIEKQQQNGCYSVNITATDYFLLERRL